MIGPTIKCQECGCKHAATIQGGVVWYICQRNWKPPLYVSDPWNVRGVYALDGDYIVTAGPPLEASWAAYEQSVAL